MHPQKEEFLEKAKRLDVFTQAVSIFQLPFCFGAQGVLINLSGSNDHPE